MQRNSIHYLVQISLKVICGILLLADVVSASELENTLRVFTWDGYVTSEDVAANFARFSMS